MTKKIRIREMKCFDEVAAVIGKVDAERELFIAVSDYDKESESNYPYKYNYALSLFQAFQWDCTPQGWDFWFDINSGVNPYTGEKV